LGQDTVTLFREEVEMLPLGGIRVVELIVGMEG
jgi:hypothetical protein